MSTDRRTTHRVALPDLGSLDPATTHRGERATSPVAQQLLTRILETPRTAGGDADADVRTRAEQFTPRHGGVPRRRWIMAGGVAALALVAVALPPLTGTSGSAFASWTPTPSTVAPAEAAGHRAECLAAGPDPRGSVTAALTERPGDFTFTLVATRQAVGNCMLLDPAPLEVGGQDEQGVTSWGRRQRPSGPAGRQHEPPVGASFLSGAGGFTSAVGRAGSDVVAVEVAPEGGQPVRASVGGGYVIAWWPGEPRNRLTVTTTVADGTRTTRTLQLGEH